MLFLNVFPPLGKFEFLTNWWRLWRFDHCILLGCMTGMAHFFKSWVQSRALNKQKIEIKSRFGIFYFHLQRIRKQKVMARGRLYYSFTLCFFKDVFLSHQFFWFFYVNPHKMERMFIHSIIENLIWNYWSHYFTKFYFLSEINMDVICL